MYRDSHSLSHGFAASIFKVMTVLLGKYLLLTFLGKVLVGHLPKSTHPPRSLLLTVFKSCSNFARCGTEIISG